MAHGNFPREKFLKTLDQTHRDCRYIASAPFNEYVHSESTKSQDVVSHRFLRPKLCTISFSPSMNVVYLPVKEPGSAIPLVQPQPTGILSKAKSFPKGSGVQEAYRRLCGRGEGEPAVGLWVLIHSPIIPCTRPVCQRLPRHCGPKDGFSNPAVH